MNEKKTWSFIKGVCKNHTGKMEGMWSYSTSVLLNENCKRYRSIEGSICQHCYSERMHKRYKGLEEKTARNTEYITTHEMTEEDVPFLNCAMFRWESFGDLNNELQVKNYFLVTALNPQTRFALWTKNPNIIAKAIKKYGLTKPENLEIVVSSLFVNTPLSIARLQEKYPFVDRVFTVYDKDHADDVVINCGARHCGTCQTCYKADGADTVNELIK